MPMFESICPRGFQHTLLDILIRFPENPKCTNLHFLKLALSVISVAVCDKEDVTECQECFGKILYGDFGDGWSDIKLSSLTEVRNE